MTDLTAISDEELDALALAADPDLVLDDDAVPFVIDGPGGPDLLPGWYMPVPQSTKRTPARMIGAATIIGSLVLVNAAGLCVTYGFPEIAW
jgi:hypothetical protein